MKKCVFAGSFDPITNGHLEIIEKATEQFDDVCVGILRNRDKQYYFSLESRYLAVKKSLESYPSVTVKTFDGMLTDFLKQENTVYFVRGIRNQADMDYELKSKEFNQKAMPNIQYIFINCSEKNKDISSTVVKRMLLNGEDISNLLPQKALQYLTKDKN